MSTATRNRHDIIDLPGVPSQTKTKTKTKTKIERYGWTIHGGPGKFELISKYKLSVDPSYQRELIENKVKTIVAEFDWYAFGVLLVARRANGANLVTDGGHRLASAMRREDVQELPCMVFQLESVVQEAQAFLVQNTNRKPVSAIDKFKAKIVIGDPIAMEVESQLKLHGYSIMLAMNDSPCIKCVGTLQGCAQTDTAIFRDVFKLVVEIVDSGPIHDRIFQAVFYAERTLRKQGLSLLKTPWKARVVALGSKGILDAAAEANRYYSEGGAKIWASGLVKALNHGVKNRISIDRNNSEDP